MTGAKLLLIDDEEAQVRELSADLSERSMNVSIVATADDALAQLDREPFIDVTLLAMKPSGTQGIETLRRIKQRHPLVEVIVLTGEDHVHTAIEAMKQGAFDYAARPWDMEAMLLKIASAKEKKRAHQEKILIATREELLRRRRS